MNKSFLEEIPLCLHTVFNQSYAHMDETDGYAYALFVYCDVIHDYAVGCLFKDTKHVYFTLLQEYNWLLPDATQISPDYMDINVLF
jgi:hypothetical protein